MVRYRYSDLRSDAVDFGTQLARGARDAGCSIWRSYAGNYVPSNPATASIRWFWNTVCSEPFQPPPPPYTGGQCNFPYTVKTRANYLMKQQPSDSGVNVAVEYLFERVPGKIFPGDLIYLLPGTEFGGTNRAPRANFKGALDSNWGLISPPSFNQWNNHVFNKVLSHVIASVIPTSGQPDNCGDLPTRYPQPPPLPDGGITINVNIEDNDGNTINIPLVFNDLEFNMPVTFRFDGGFIEIDIGGVSINWNGDFNINLGGDGDASKSPFPESPGGGGGGGGRDPQPGDDGVEEKPPVEVEDNEEVEEVEEEDEQILWVEILMINPPDYKHRILYRNADMNVYYGGWLAWTGGDGSLNAAPEIPIRRSRTLVRKPDEYTGYKVRAINGASYTVKSYTQKIIKKPSKEEES